MIAAPTRKPLDDRRRSQLLRRHGEDRLPGMLLGDGYQRSGYCLPGGGCGIWVTLVGLGLGETHASALEVHAPAAGSQLRGIELVALKLHVARAAMARIKAELITH